MFVNFGVIISVYVFSSLIAGLPLRLWAKLALLLATFAGAGRYAVMRAVFGGLGGIEAPRWLLLGTSLVQGTLVLLFLFLILRDLLWLLSLPGVAATAGFRRAIRGTGAAWTLLAASVILSAAGLYSAAKVPEVRQREVVLSGWPSGLDGLRVAVLADMHISRFFDRRWVRRVVDLTNAEAPDMIWMPGDMVDGATEARAPDVAPLADLKAPCGVFGSMGNHEYISGALEWLPVFRRLGIEILYNSHVRPAVGDASFVLAGVNDSSATRPRTNLPGPDLPGALAGAPADLPVVLLEHRPGRARSNAENQRIVLQVSGHTHGGMVPILASFVRRANDGFVSGFYDVGALKLFVAPGLGLWSGFPMRLLSPSEITILTIKAGPPAAAAGEAGAADSADAAEVADASPRPGPSGPASARRSEPC
jgi:predicted MPP superfamily phosphohydrolase